MNYTCTVLFPKGTIQRDIQRTGQYLQVLIKLKWHADQPDAKSWGTWCVNYGDAMTKKQLIKRIEFNKSRLKTLMEQIK